MGPIQNTIKMLSGDTYMYEDEKKKNSAWYKHWNSKLW